MKEKELRQHADCSVCGKPIGSSGVPFFWTAELTWYGLDFQAMRRQDGLAAHMGSGALAAILGPNEDMAKAVSEPINITICQTCATEQMVVVAAMQAIEDRSQAEEQQEEMR